MKVLTKILCWVFTLCLTFLLIASVCNWQKFLLNSKWVEVKGKIENLSPNWERETTPHFNFMYKYAFQGNTYESNNIRLCVFKENEDSLDFFNLLNKFSNEGDFSVYVNPDKPEEAYLVREITVSMWLYPALSLIWFGGMAFEMKRNRNLFEK